MRFYASYWVIIDPYASLCVLMGLYKSLFIMGLMGYMQSYGSLWVFISYYVSLWNLIGPYGFL